MSMILEGDEMFFTHAIEAERGKLRGCFLTRAVLLRPDFASNFVILGPYPFSPPISP
jgi:hypothetical protein